MSSAALAAASASAGAAAVAAVAAVLDGDTRSGRRAVGLAAAAGTGGLVGYLLWRSTQHPLRAAREAAAEAAAKEARVLDLIDMIHARQPRRMQDALDEAGYAAEVARWVGELRGTSLPAASPALQIAARAQGLERDLVPRDSFPQGRVGFVDWERTVKTTLANRLDEIMLAVGLPEGTARRVRSLVLRELKDDSETQTLEDAVCLVFLDHLAHRFQQAEGDQMLSFVLQGTWRILSSSARERALGFDYSPRLLATLVEAVAEAEGLRPDGASVFAPRLPPGTAAVLGGSWARVDGEAFGVEFLRLLGESEDCAPLRKVLAGPLFRPCNVPKVVRMLLDHLASGMLPRFERLVYCMTLLGHRFGGLRAMHMAPIKNALVRAVAIHIPGDEVRSVCTAWEAFSYALCAVSVPQLLMADRVDESPGSVASALPVPCASGAAGLLAVQGVSMLEMCFRTTAESEYGPCSVVERLVEARTWLLDAVRESHASICGLIAMCFCDVPRGAQPTGRLLDRSGITNGDTEELCAVEKRRWQVRSIEVPLHIAELISGVLLVIKDHKAYVKPSLRRSWVASLQLLETAVAIAADDVAADLAAWSGEQVVCDEVQHLMKRFSHFESFELPWDELFGPES